MISKERGTACITGASRGLGRAMVEAFLKNSNLDVAAVTRSESLSGIPSGSAANRLHTISADITTEAGRAAVYKELERLPELSVLIHNAGALAFRPFAETDDNTLRHIYEVNVFAPYLLTQKLLPLAGRTHIINVSSIGGVQGSLKFGGLSAYSSSKAALNCLTEMWSEEFKDTDTVFNCLALGSVETDMFQEAFPGVSAACTPETMATYIAEFAFSAPSVMKGKVISLSLGNP